MKSIVVYYSESGNTQKLAEAIAKGMGTQAKSIGEVKAQELAGYDLICIGTPVQGGAPAKKVTKFIEQMPDMTGKKAAAFCTVHGFGADKTLAALKKVLEGRGMVFLGSISALGWSRLIANFGPRVFNRGKPDASDLTRAEEFGRSLLSKK